MCKTHEVTILNSYLGEGGGVGGGGGVGEGGESHDFISRTDPNDIWKWETKTCSDAHNIIKSSNIYEQIIFILSNTPIQWRHDEDAKVYMLINHVIHQRSKHQKSRYIFLEAVKAISNEQTYDNLLYWL